MEISIRNQLYRFIACFVALNFFCSNAYPDNPELSKIEGSNLTWKEGSGKIRITENIRISYRTEDDDDHDGNKLSMAIIQITGGFVTNEDRLTANVSGDISARWNESTGTLTITGEESVSKYERALRHVYYNHDGSAVTPGIKVIRFTVYDGDKASNTLSRNLVVESADPTHEPPPIPTPSPAPTPSPEPTPEPAPTPPKNNPTAVISGEDTICAGQEAALTVTLTGKSPWSIVVRYGSKQKTINNIRTAIYILKVTDEGTYTLKSMRDASSSGKVSGSAKVTKYQAPTAIISGDAIICNEPETSVKVTLTGNAPWRFSYRHDSDAPVGVDNVMLNSYLLKVSKSGLYTLTEVYDKYCKGTVSGTAKVTFSTPPEVSISGLKSEYSKESEEWIEITGTPSGGSFSGTGVIPYNGDWFFLPNLAPVGVNHIVYKYSETEGCFGFDTASVKILEKGAEIIFDTDRTKLCRNDEPLTMKGRSLFNETNGTFTISGGIGLTDHGNNTATLYPDKLDAQNYTITYTTTDGTSVTKDVEIGEELLADFTWATQCFNASQPILFTSTSRSEFGILTETSYTWKVKETGELNTSPESFSYAFANPGHYSVTLELQNSLGCFDTVTKVLSLEPVITLDGQSYFESFENPSSAWHSGSVDSINSWTLGNSFGEASTDQHAWLTDLNNSLAPKEQSWLIGPCFDFSNSSKPVLVAQIQRYFSDDRDGAYFQYSADNGVTWTKIGDLDDGLNWYNGYYGNTAGKISGWTNIKDAHWVESRHALDFLVGKPLVQFRLYYEATGTADDNKGIAIDHIRIAERNRMTLVEHFTNTSDEDTQAADSLLDNLSALNNSLINIQYHTANPSADPFYDDNPVIPTTRQFYYGLSEVVPFAIINGGVSDFQRIDFHTTLIDDKKVMIQSLYDSDFKIDFQTMIRDSFLYAMATITALDDIPLSELSIRIAVIEEQIDNITGSNGDAVFNNVVKTMLPGAAGTTAYREWNKNDSAVVWEKWKMKNIYNAERIRAVVFIQNESTHEIYQSALDNRGIITANENDAIDKTDRPFILFPNPAGEMVTILFNDVTSVEHTIECYSDIGSLLFSYQIPKGTLQQQIATGSIPSGIYLIRVMDSKGVLGNSKLVISR